ncbi:hypothetical protein F4703DRAFT_1921651, partial [Phycomyces blakesleeanus]
MNTHPENIVAVPSIHQDNRVQISEQACAHLLDNAQQCLSSPGHPMTTLSPNQPFTFSPAHHEIPLHFNIGSHLTTPEEGQSLINHPLLPAREQPSGPCTPQPSSSSGAPDILHQEQILCQQQSQSPHNDLKQEQLQHASRSPSQQTPQHSGNMLEHHYGQQLSLALATATQQNQTVQLQHMYAGSQTLDTHSPMPALSQDLINQHSQAEIEHMAMLVKQNSTPLTQGAHLPVTQSVESPHQPALVPIHTPPVAMHSHPNPGREPQELNQLNSNNISHDSTPQHTPILVSPSQLQEESDLNRGLLENMHSNLMLQHDPMLNVAQHQQQQNQDHQLHQLQINHQSLQGNDHLNLQQQQQLQLQAHEQQQQQQAQQQQAQQQQVQQQQAQQQQAQQQQAQQQQAQQQQAQQQQAQQQQAQQQQAQQQQAQQQQAQQQQA